MTRRISWSLALATLALAGCPTNQPAGVTPSVAPTVCPPASTAAPSTAPTATPTPAPTGFRDDFEGSSLDPTRWSSYAQTGLIRFENGKLDLLNTANQKNFPYVLSKRAIVPEEGAFFVEFDYTVLSPGTTVSFSLDYLPAEAPNEKPLTTPFMSTTWFYNNLKLTFDTENGQPSFQGIKGYLPNVAHRVRIEQDGGTTYRVIFDTTEIGTFQSKRRPTRFWIGANPVADLKSGVSWPRLQLDYVAAGALTAPDPAAPIAPSPSP